MSLTLRRVKGSDGLAMVTRLLRRTRLADPTAGVWEAADLHWWSRKTRASDDVEQLIWLDDDGPAAAVYLSSWDGSWQCDVLRSPDAGADLDLEELWQRALEHGLAHAEAMDLPVADGDEALTALAAGSELVRSSQDSTAWLDVADRPAVRALPAGMSLVDRAGEPTTDHPMVGRNGPDVADRLALSPLYDPSLDLAVVADDGRVAAYSLYWCDPVTGVGLVEPVRVEDDFQRQGLASSMLTEGLARLADRGARRLKISYGSEAAAATYRGVGFVPTSSSSWYRAERTT